jgi:hypothetical protein
VPLTRVRVAFEGLACHLWPCMSLKVRFVADSIPSALTILFNQLPISLDSRGAYLG